jgi:hypothetical protein
VDEYYFPPYGAVTAKPKLAPCRVVGRAKLTAITAFKNYQYGWISKFNMNTGEYNYWKPLLNKAFLINSLAR